jgi:hypothetical protein
MMGRRRLAECDLGGDLREEADVRGPTLIIMGAGEGRRYGGAKPLASIGSHNETLVEFSIYDALLTGFERVVFVVRAETEAAFRRRFQPLLAERCELAYVRQETDDVPAGFNNVAGGRSKPWGTAHAVWSCRHAVTGPFGVVNADDFYGRGALEVVGRFLRCEASQDEGADFALAGYELGKTLTDFGAVSRGICRTDGNGYLLEIVERRRVERRPHGTSYTEDGTTWHEIPEGTTASMNLWGFGVRVFDELGRGLAHFLQGLSGDTTEAEFGLSTAVGEMVRQGRARVRVLATDARWFGITYRQDIVAAREAIGELTRRGVYPTPLWAAVS